MIDIHDIYFDKNTYHDKETLKISININIWRFNMFNKYHNIVHSYVYEL